MTIAAIALCGTPDGCRRRGGKDDPEPARTASRAEDDFLAETRIACMYEIASGELAASRAEASPLRGLARRMTEEHRRLSAAVGQLAATHHLDLPASLDGRHRDLLSTLQARAGIDFDRTYLDQQRSVQETMVPLFERAASDPGGEPFTRAFAGDALPAVRARLLAVRSFALAQHPSPGGGPP